MACMEQRTCVVSSSTSTSACAPDAARPMQVVVAVVSLQVLEDLLAGELAGRTHDAPAGVGARAALVVAVDRRAVLAPARRRAEEVHLRREELPGEDVALGQPDVRSMSSGVTTSRCSTRSPKPGKNDSNVACTVSAKFSRSVSQSLPLRWYGAYCTKHDMTCLPGGAMSGSTNDWIAQSMYGPLAVPAVLRVVEGPLEVLHRRADVDEAAVLVGAVAERRVDAAAPSRAKLTLADVPWNLQPVDVLDQVGGQLARLDELVNVRRGSSALTTVFAVSSVPSSSATPTARPSSVITWSTGASS